MKELQEEIDLLNELITVNQVKRRNAIGRAMIDKLDGNIVKLTRTKNRLEKEIGRREAESKAQTTLFS